jgi:hypothetical protein
MWQRHSVRRYSDSGLSGVGNMTGGAFPFSAKLEELVEKGAGDEDLDSRMTDLEIDEVSWNCPHPAFIKTMADEFSYSFSPLNPLSTILGRSQNMA